MTISEFPFDNVNARNVRQRNNCSFLGKVQDGRRRREEHLCFHNKMGDSSDRGGHTSEIIRLGCLLYFLYMRLYSRICSCDVSVFIYSIIDLLLSSDISSAALL